MMSCHYCGDRTEGNNSGMCDACDLRMNGRTTGRTSYGVSMEITRKTFVRMTEDGESCDYSLSEFLENNPQLTAEEIEQLHAGDVVFLGGGASPEVQVQLITSETPGV